MIALAGMMLFAFSQCGDNNDSKKEKEESTASDPVGSIKKTIKAYDKALDGAEKCEDLTKATTDFEKAMKEELKDADSTKISKEDRDEILKLSAEVVTKASNKTAELCK